MPQLGAQFNRRRLLLLAIVAIALYVIVPQMGGFRDSWQHLRSPDPVAVIMAGIFTALTYGFAALTYLLLAFRRLRYWSTVLIQLAAMFVNRLLPAGIGALGVNYAYLHRQKHTAAQATTVVGINNVLGFTGHMIILGVALLLSQNQLAGGTNRLWWTLPAVLIGLTLLLLLGYSFGGRRVRGFIVQLRQQLVSYRRRPRRLGAALCSSIGLTLANIISLYFCMLAIDVHLPLVAVVIIFSFGIAAGTATPTPGGLGGFEAGLVAGFAAYDVTAGAALAIALLYRLISYWLTLVAGGVAFGLAQRRHMLKL